MFHHQQQQQRQDTKVQGSHLHSSTNLHTSSLTWHAIAKLLASNASHNSGTSTLWELKADTYTYTWFFLDLKKDWRHKSPKRKISKNKCRYSHLIGKDATACVLLSSIFSGSTSIHFICLLTATNLTKQLLRLRFSRQHFGQLRRRSRLNQRISVGMQRKLEEYTPGSLTP